MRRIHERGWGLVMYAESDDVVACGSRDASVGNRDVIVYRLPNRSLIDNCELLIRSIDSVSLDSNDLLDCDLSQRSNEGRKLDSDEGYSEGRNPEWRLDEDGAQLGMEVEW